MSKSFKGQGYAVGSGLLAATAGLCGKYAMARDEAEELCVNLVQFSDKMENDFSTVFCDEYLSLMRFFFFILMILTNGVMWTTFTKALRFSQTSLEATITNTAANFFFTAIIGQVFCGETVTTLWWIGTVLIICGLLLMHHSRNPTQRKPGTRIKKNQ